MVEMGASVGLVGCAAAGVAGWSGGMVGVSAAETMVERRRRAARAVRRGKGARSASVTRCGGCVGRAWVGCAGVMVVWLVGVLVWSCWGG